MLNTSERSQAATYKKRVAEPGISTLKRLEELGPEESKCTRVQHRGHDHLLTKTSLTGLCFEKSRTEYVLTPMPPRDG